MVDVAKAAGLEVRFVDGSSVGEVEGPTRSGMCRVRDGWWIVLSAADPLDRHVEVLAEALRDHGASVLEHRYVPPAVRERLEREPER
jgi:hypothetical protein